jgi:Transposase, Mutator family
MRLAEGHVMSGTSMVASKRDGDPPPRPPLVDEELADQLLGKAHAEGVELLGPDGLLSQVTKAVLERALAEEMTGHLGYERHDPAGRGSGNSRNGTSGGLAVRSAGPAGPVCDLDCDAPDLPVSSWTEPAAVWSRPASSSVLICPLRCRGRAGAAAARAYVRKTLAKMSHARACFRSPLAAG